MFDLKKSFKSDLIRRTFYKYGKLGTPITTHILKNAMKITEKTLFKEKKNPSNPRNILNAINRLTP